MAAITFTNYCPRCNHYQKVPIQLAGHKIACPGCKTVVGLPARGEILAETIDLFPVSSDSGSSSGHIA